MFTVHILSTQEGYNTIATLRYAECVHIRH